jgi:hypothetical protein
MKHKQKALIFVAGMFAGYLLTYYMISQTVSYKVEEAYELGFRFGIQNHSFIQSDSLNINQ